MEITQIDVYQVDLPYSGGRYVLSGGRSFENFDATIVRITTSCGIQGWGESTPFGATYVAAHGLGVRAGLQQVAPHLLGRDPRFVDRNYEVMDAALLGHPAVKTPLDVACWDIFAKSVDMPVCDLLGGSSEQKLPLISSIHAADPQSMRKNVADHRARGYLAHSIKIGASEIEGGPMLDAQRISECLADRQANEYFLVDANGGLSVEHALRLLKILPKELDFVLEAPCATWSETLRLRRHTNIPIYIDELADSDAAVASIVSSQIADGVGIKISKNGGLTQCRRQRDICQAAGLVMSVQDTVGSSIAFAAIVHLAQSVPTKWLRYVLDTRDMVSVDTAKFDCELVNGGIYAPRLPGLGVEPDLSLLGEPVQTYC